MAAAMQLVISDQIRVLDEEYRYLAEIPEARVQEVFSAPGGLTPVVDEIERLAKDFTPDISTAEGRAQIKSMAHKVTRSKTFLDDLGKGLVANLKELPKRIDANRKEMRDRLDALAAEVRQPFTDWEAHTLEISNRLNWIDGLPASLTNASSAEVDAAYAKTIIFEPVSEDAWESFYDEAKAIIPRTNHALSELFMVRQKVEADAAELERLRKAAAERERKEVEDRRIKEAAEQARREAEERAEREKQAALGREAEAKRQAELAEQRLAEAKRLAEERDREYQRQREEQDRIAAERAERARQEAVASEQKRQADEAERAAAEEAKRKADKDHFRQVNSEVLADIMEVIAGTPESTDTITLSVSRAIVIAIAKGHVRHTAITY